MNGCKTPEQVLTYGSPLAKRVKSNVVMQQSLKNLTYQKRPLARDYSGWVKSYSIRSEGGFTPSREYVGGAVNAFVEYTFGGPVELLAGKSLTQAAVLTGLGVYGTLRLGVAVELGMDFAIVGAAATATDPANKWEGGLDEWGFFGGNDPNALTVGMEGSATPAQWGWRQGWASSPANPANW